eukprot:7043697-Pyramimonas_sp.AAC.1
MEEGGGMGQREGRKEGTQGDVPSKREPNTTGWLGKNQISLTRGSTTCRCGYRNNDSLCRWRSL